MKKILLVFGTSPEAIKMPPPVKSFQGQNQTFKTKVCVTASNRVFKGLDAGNKIILGFCEILNK
jgi:UDP-N-acetylglucosamine 2-epimerase